MLFADGRAAPFAALLAGALTLVVVSVAMRAGTEPFATWYYPLAWFSTLLMLDAVAALRGGGRLFFVARPNAILSMLAWSVPFWLFFELLNFRLENWYYVFVPDDPVARWAGIGLSFATVLPAIFLAKRALGRSENSSDTRPDPTLRPTQLYAIQLIGAGTLLTPLVWPTFLFPLIWVGGLLLADPWVYKRDPDRSLLADLEHRRPGRVLRLLVSGMVIGLLWELYNISARGKWIYTVPGLEELKLFEMPLLGFFGFPVFALEGFAVYQALVVSGLAAPDRGHTKTASRTVRRLAAVLAIAFSALVLLGMERYTISSMTPRLADLVDGVSSSALEHAGYDIFSLAESDATLVAAQTGLPLETVRVWVDRAQLSVLRGIGSENAKRLQAVGVSTITELATADPDRLVERLRGGSALPVYPARVRVWVHAAQDAIGAAP
jgi:hypothetical protein